MESVKHGEDVIKLSNELLSSLLHDELSCDTTLLTDLNGFVTEDLLQISLSLLATVSATGLTASRSGRTWLVLTVSIRSSVALVLVQYLTGVERLGRNVVVGPV